MNYIIPITVGIVMFFIGFLVMELIRRAKIKKATNIADKIIEKSKEEAENYKRNAKEEMQKKWSLKKQEFEWETKNRRRELAQLEKRLNEREVNIERKNNLLMRKEKDIIHRERELIQKEKSIKLKDARYTSLLREENARLERIAGMTSEQAKRQLMDNLKDQAKYEAAKMIREIKEKAVEEGGKKAKEIITLAIQKSAMEHVSESTVSVVALPNDEMKGRIIGREGRNIRAFENLTGVEAIVDDTPGAVTLSGFDPIRREVAKRSLEKLVADGRIHPARIEEIIEKTEKEIEETIKTTGEETVMDMTITGIHPELVKLLGRLKFRTSYGQNVLLHSKEVATISALMAGELRLDVEDAKRAGLLHDIGKAVDQNYEGTHAKIGAELAEKYGESQIVINAIAAHHEEVDVETPISVLIQAADTISGARPGARRETLEAYIKRLERLEEIALSFDGVSKAYAMQAGREIRIVVEPDRLDDFRCKELAEHIAQKIESELKYPGQIKVTVIRETRAVEFAK
ncbi:ribonuclease Y [candidate division WOR-3 bacterium]|nr:ribonuclease Y [candidate division WOR-3 bacterium]TET79802.1 MAG: ribonuclease Y [Candidatus Cloacimonadota bacterium]